MVEYLLKRVGLAALVVVLTAVLLALAVHLVPGDPAKIVLGQHATPDLMAQVRAEMGLDKPVPRQVWDFLSGAVRGDLGTDFVYQIPVTTMIREAAPNTIALALMSVILSIGVGIPLGISVARRPGGTLDRLTHAVAMVLISAPPYVTALVLLLLFAVRLRWFPALGAGSGSDPWDYLLHLLLPAIALSAFWWGYLPRLVRATMLEVMTAPYIRSARAFGVGERVVFYKFALRNAIVPVVALLGLLLGYTLTGTVYAEIIFGRQGLGSLALSALSQRDWPVIRAVVLAYALFFTLGNLLADIAHRCLDPRVTIGEAMDGPV
jgi:peptide/nickel transport system permease protein